MENKLLLCQTIKHIHDSIHNYIPLSTFAVHIIDNPKFQRLRHLKQLGACFYVFPNATHTRFEHSIGTYYLAKQLIHTLKRHVNPDSITEYLSSIPHLTHHFTTCNISPQLDTYVCELIGIAALCHDIGHGPYSHLFDDVFMSHLKKQNTPFSSHEERSELILEHIIKSDPHLQPIIHNDDISFMKTLINPDQSIHNGFLYQIVSNTLNGLDVDKFDYLPRDIKAINFQGRVDISRLIYDARIINNNIAYPKQALADAHNLYHTRHQLHRQIYCHKFVLAVQHVIVDIMIQLNHTLEISSSINNPDKFCDLTDNFIFEAPKILKQLGHNTTIVDDLITRIHNRQLYSFVASSSTEFKPDLQFLYDEFQDSNKNLIIHQVKIGFISGNKQNPLDNIFVYSTKDVSRILTKLECQGDLTIMLPPMYQEYLTVVFYKDKKNIDMIKLIRNRFCRLAYPVA